MARSAAPSARPSLAGAPPPAGVRAGLKASHADKPMLVRGGAVSERRSAPPSPPVAAGGRPGYLGSSSWQGHPHEVTLEVGREHLTYSNLRMPGPDEGGRGKLRPQDVVDMAVDQLKRRGLETNVNLRHVLQSAQQRARAVANMQLLAGHRAPGSLAGFDYLYPGDGLVDVPSNGHFHSLPLLVRALPARAEYITVPRVTSDVFRVVEIESLPDLALPGGPTDVYVGGDFQVATQLADTSPGGTIRLGLGVEQQVKVARNTTYKETTAGMMGGTAQLRHTLSIEVNNRMDHEIRVQVQERLPEAAKGQDEIKIKVEEAKPAWESFLVPERPELKAAYRWQVKVDPKSRLTLKATYLIEIPSKLELQGGNRREA